MESEPDEESQDSREYEETQVINVIPVHFDETYAELGESRESSPQATPSAVKGKYYKQTYRTAWEQMPDFKGWLRGVQGEPTRAYCMYCEKTLHAHRLSLLKHTCTIRHQKAAQIHNIRKNKEDSNDNSKEKNVLVNMNEEQIVGEPSETIIEYTEHSGTDDGEQEIEENDDEEDEQNFTMHFQKLRNQNLNTMSTGRPPISTHVLDTSKGIPVVGLQVSLYKLIDGRWTYINEGITTTDGRFSSFLDRENFSTGRYKLHYDVDRFFESRKQESLYPFIEIVFDCRSSSEHYHVPLLLSPYGYTTYRGS